ncbi:type II secretion system protein [Pelagicoccus sp. SDUM812002]|uniref:type II secretion system protein n=1 Tax=Pelagicoccus sp. SDUM812002 TaxID=3041266 RepID=UPI00280DC953|nr:type II secretion system protein [Pelagicoccus sp. SDUM812002]MDQ8187565.1 type II secretion system protein [Pelagicoccus sp. SDUM812002]
MNRKISKKAFTILEVVVALAMLALIAVPAIGLATMVVKSSKAQMASSTASELKARVDIALRALAEDDTLDDDLTLVATRDLRFIEIESNTSISTQDQYYQITVREPAGYSYSTDDSFRLIVYEATWPYKSDDVGGRNQLFFTTVFRK